MIIKIINDQVNLIGPGGQHRVLSFAEALHRAGIKVILVTPYFQVDYDYFKRNYHKFYIDREYLYLSKNKVRFMIDNTVRLLLKELDSEPPDIYIIGLPVPLLRGLVKYAASLRKVPYILDFGDPWFSPSDPLLWRWLMDSYLLRLLKDAPAITVPNEWFRTHLKVMIRNNINILRKIYVLYPSALYTIDPSTIKARDYSTLKFVHLGELPRNSISDIVKMLKHIYIKTKTNIEFTIIGGSQNVYSVKEHVLKEKLGNAINVTYAPPISRFNVYSFIKNYHIGLSVHEGIYWKPINELKIVDYLASGLTVISTFKTDLLINNVNSFISRDLSIIYERIPYNYQELLMNMSMNSLSIARNCCSYYQVAKNILNIINVIYAKDR